MSKFILFEFACNECGHEFDELVKPEIYSAPCPKCGKKAERQLSAGHLDWKLGVQSSSFPTLASKWARMQEQKARVDKGGRHDGAPNLKMY